MAGHHVFKDLCSPDMSVTEELRPSLAMNYECHLFVLNPGAGDKRRIVFTLVLLLNHSHRSSTAGRNLCGVDIRTHLSLLSVSAIPSVSGGNGISSDGVGDILRPITILLEEPALG